MDRNFKNKLAEKFGGNCLFDAKLAPFTSYKIGGNADALVFPESAEDLKQLLALCEECGVPLTIIGAGSNVLVSDFGIRGATACTRRMEKIEISGSKVYAQSGALLDKIVSETVSAGLKGMERLSGIPGTAGGAALMNAGAFEQETFGRLSFFEAVTRQGEVKKISKDGVKFFYRRVEGIGDMIILSAEWELEKGNASELKKEREFVLKTRAEKQPLEYPSAGSVFKRPEGDYASRLIDMSGFKGFRIGDAQISSKHAGFIVNRGNASAKDVAELMRIIKAKVKEKTGIDLELEQILLGEF